jgi:hypothetical protein
MENNKLVLAGIMYRITNFTNRKSEHRYHKLYYSFQAISLNLWSLPEAGLLL